MPGNLNVVDPVACVHRHPTTLVDVSRKERIIILVELPLDLELSIRHDGSILENRFVIPLFKGLSVIACRHAFFFLVIEPPRAGVRREDLMQLRAPCFW